VHQQGLYKISLYARGKDATVKDFKLEILICFNSPITEHWTPLYQISNLCGIGSIRWRSTKVLGASEADDQYVRIQRCS